MLYNKYRSNDRAPPFLAGRETSMLTQASDPPAAAAAMGPDYPRAVLGPLASLAAKGAQACPR